MRHWDVLIVVFLVLFVVTTLLAVGGLSLWTTILGIVTAIVGIWAAIGFFLDLLGGQR